MANAEPVTFDPELSSELLFKATRGRLATGSFSQRRSVLSKGGRGEVKTLFLFKLE